VIQVASAVKVDERSLSRNLGKVTGSLGALNRLQSSIQAINVCLVVLGMMELHDFAVDVGFECAVVI